MPEHVHVIKYKRIIIKRSFQYKKGFEKTPIQVWIFIPKPIYNYLTNVAIKVYKNVTPEGNM